MKLRLGPRGLKILNYYLALNVVAFVAWGIYGAVSEGRFDYREAGFAAQNILLAVLFIARKNPVETDSSLLNQAVAIVAFCSGALFMGRPSTGDPLILNISSTIIFAANVLGFVTLLNLGKSFGILIAYREVKSSGLYSVVRHPMYGTDILLRIGYLTSHFNGLTAALFVLSSGCYVYRAMLEERFLGKRAEYRDYMARVRYRFIPYVF